MKDVPGVVVAVEDDDGLLVLVDVDGLVIVGG